MGFSSRRIAVFIITLFLLGSGIVYIIGSFKAKQTEDVEGEGQKTEGLSGEIVLGAISTYPGDAEYMNPAMEIALEEVNEHVSELGLDVTFSIRFEDADSSDTTSLAKFKELAESDVRVVLGMWWSSQLEAVREYADERQILVISSASTAPSLAIQDDYIFRLVPSDVSQARALARMMRDKGIEAAVVLQQDNIWGDGIGEGFVERFEELGGVVVDHIRYTPFQTLTRSQFSRAAEKVESAVEEYGEGKVAVEAISMGEIEAILPQAEDYPPLAEVPWFGADGYVRWVALVERYPEISLRTRHYSPLAAANESSRWQEFAGKFRARTGMKLRHYESESYDSVWVAALAVIRAGEYDADHIKEVLPEVCASYYGASGCLKLDEYGDKASGNYDIYAVTDDEGLVAWRKVGVYFSETDSIEWH